MIKQIKNLKKSRLFQGIPYTVFENMIEQLDSQLKFYRSRQLVIPAGKTLKRPGVLFEGSLSIYQKDFWGNTQPVATIQEGEIFGETIAFSHVPSDVFIEAETASVVLWFDLSDFLSLRAEDTYKQKLIKNFTEDFASKNLHLQRQLAHLAKRTTKEKILAYLSDLSLQLHTNEFDIPFSRQELADYLGVERAALSTEIHRLAKENYFSVSQKHFILHRDA